MERIGLYKLIVSARISDDDQFEMSLRGVLSEAGQEAMEIDPDFKELVDALTLAAAKVFHDKENSEGAVIQHRGKAGKSPAMAEHLAAIGSVAMEVSDAPAL